MEDGIGGAPNCNRLFFPRSKIRVPRLNVLRLSCFSF
jgi:hypothetical protein